MIQDFLPRTSMRLSEYFGKTMHATAAPFRVIGFPCFDNDSALIVKSDGLPTGNFPALVWKNLSTSGVPWGLKYVVILDAFQGDFDSISSRHDGNREEVILAFREINISQADIISAREAIREYTGIQSVHPWLSIDLQSGKYASPEPTPWTPHPMHNFHTRDPRPTNLNAVFGDFVGPNPYGIGQSPFHRPPCGMPTTPIVTPVTSNNGARTMLSDYVREHLRRNPAMFQGFKIAFESTVSIRFPATKLLPGFVHSWKNFHDGYAGNNPILKAFTYTGRHFVPLQQMELFLFHDMEIDQAMIEAARHEMAMLNEKSKVPIGFPFLVHQLSGWNSYRNEVTVSIPEGKRELEEALARMHAFPRIVAKGQMRDLNNALRDFMVKAHSDAHAPDVKKKPDWMEPALERIRATVLGINPSPTREKVFAGAESLNLNARQYLRSLHDQGVLANAAFPDKAGLRQLIDLGFASTVVIDQKSGFFGCTNTGKMAVKMLGALYPNEK